MGAEMVEVSSRIEVYRRMKRIDPDEGAVYVTVAIYGMVVFSRDDGREHETPVITVAYTRRIRLGESFWRDLERFEDELQRRIEQVERDLEEFRCEIAELVRRGILPDFD